MVGFRPWARPSASGLADLVAAALPDDDLPAQTLAELCWDDPDPGVVLGYQSGGVPLAAGAAVVRRHGERNIGFVRLLAVAPPEQGGGLGRALLDGLEEWARDQGAVELRLGGEAPHYVWPGVDVALTPALCLAEAAGYLDRGAALNLGCSTVVPLAPAPDGIEIVPVDAAAGSCGLAPDLTAALALVRAHWPWWEPEVRRAAARGGCWAAVTGGGDVVGLGCHGANRPGWFGPIGTAPAVAVRGVGTAVLTAVLADMADRGHSHAEISWIGPVGFYARTVGATVSHVYRTLAKPMSP